jgi:hypothetical protein
VPLQLSNVGLEIPMAAPAFLMNDTSRTVTTAGLTRMAASGGTMFWQINTAVAGDFGTSITPLAYNSSGNLIFGAVPTSAGGGGLYVCIDTAGVIYKKAACP